MKNKIYKAGALLASTVFLLLLLCQINSQAEESNDGSNVGFSTEGSIDLAIDANYDDLISEDDEPIEVSEGGIVPIGDQDDLVVSVSGFIINAIITYPEDKIKIYQGTTFIPSGTKIVSGQYQYEGLYTSASRGDVEIKLVKGDETKRQKGETRTYGQIEDQNNVTVVEVYDLILTASSNDDINFLPTDKNSAINESIDEYAVGWFDDEDTLALEAKTRPVQADHLLKWSGHPSFKDGVGQQSITFGSNFKIPVYVTCGSSQVWSELFRDSNWDENSLQVMTSPFTKIIINKEGSEVYPVARKSNYKGAVIFVLETHDGGVEGLSKWTQSGANTGTEGIYWDGDDYELTQDRIDKTGDNEVNCFIKQLIADNLTESCEFLTTPEVVSLEILSEKHLLINQSVADSQSRDFVNGETEHSIHWKITGTAETSWSKSETEKLGITLTGGFEKTAGGSIGIDSLTLESGQKASAGAEITIEKTWSQSLSGKDTISLERDFGIIKIYPTFPKAILYKQIFVLSQKANLTFYKDSNKNGVPDLDTPVEGVYNIRHDPYVNWDVKRIPADEI